MKKQNLFIVLIVLCILTLAIGYSIFKTNVEVSGKMASSKNLDVIFTKIGNIEQNRHVVGSRAANSIITRGGTSLALPRVSKLYNVLVGRQLRRMERNHPAKAVLPVEPFKLVRVLVYGVTHKPHFARFYKLRAERAALGRACHHSRAAMRKNAAHNALRIFAPKLRVA